MQEALQCAIVRSVILGCRRLDADDGVAGTIRHHSTWHRQVQNKMKRLLREFDELVRGSPIHFSFFHLSFSFTCCNLVLASKCCVNVRTTRRVFAETNSQRAL